MKKNILILAALVAISGCKKKQEPMPGLSGMRANSVACKVNGNTFYVWDGQSEGGFAFAPTASARGLFLDSLRSIFAISAGQKDYGLLIPFKFSNKTGTYPILLDSPAARLWGAWRKGQWFDAKNYLIYSSTVANPGTVVVTYYDSSSKGVTIAGTFSFDAVNRTNTVHITDGEFIFK